MSSEKKNIYKINLVYFRK